MNREVKRVSILVLAMFLTLLVSTTIVQYFQADNLASDARNARTIYESYSVQRGPILVGGNPIALSQPTTDNYKFQRTYPQPELYAPVTGYFPIGGEATGLERAANDELSGTSRSQFFDELNRIISGQDPKGASVEVTIDPVAQQAAWDALGKYKGAVIVTEPQTGRIIAMVSKPSYNPNLLTVHDGAQLADNYQNLLTDPANPLFNRAIAGDMDPPGSVFKLVVASAALASGKYTADSTFPNPLSYTLPGTNTAVRNTEGGNCGGTPTVTLATALRLSCNIPFAELAIELGEDAIKTTAEKYGFNARHDVPNRSEASIYPSGLNQAELGLTGFGQYDVRSTPLQMAMVSAGIANGGSVMNPNLVQAVLSPDLTPREQFQPSELGRAVSSEVAATLTQMMVANVDNGAASNARIDGISVAGKTGTAENGGSAPYTLWFTGFAPANNPRYAITVLVEDGGGLGQTGYGNLVAAPVAKKVLEAVLKK